MNCIVNKYSFDEAKERLSGYEYALLYMISELRFCRIEELGTVDWTQCMEARFFSDNAELHLFERSGSMIAVELSDGDEKDWNDRSYELNLSVLKGSSSLKNARRITVREYFAEDEDGQMTIDAVRLAALA